MRVLMDLIPIEPEAQVTFGPEVALPQIVFGIVAVVVAVAVVLIVKAIKKKK